MHVRGIHNVCNNAISCWNWDSVLGDFRTVRPNTPWQVRDRHVSLYIGVALSFVRIAVETSTARANLRMFCSLVNVWVRCGVLVFLQRVIDGMINVW